MKMESFFFITSDTTEIWRPQLREDGVQLLKIKLLLVKKRIF